MITVNDLDAAAVGEVGMIRVVGMAVLHGRHCHPARLDEPLQQVGIVGNHHKAEGGPCCAQRLSALCCVRNHGDGDFDSCLTDFPISPVSCRGRHGRATCSDSPPPHRRRRRSCSSRGWHRQNSGVRIGRPRRHARRIKGTGF